MHCRTAADEGTVGIDEDPGVRIRFDLLVMENRIQHRLPDIVLKPFGIGPAFAGGPLLACNNGDTVNTRRSAVMIFNADLGLAVGSR